MRVDVVWLSVLVLSLPALYQCDPLVVLSAPNLLRVGQKENVFVEAQDYDGNSFNVAILVLNFPTKTRQLYSKTVTLSKENKFQFLQEILISDGLFEFDAQPNHYVYLQAKFPWKVLEKAILVSFQSGYIFTQTDKTIYTPDDTVQYRVFALNPTLEPSSQSISVGIVNPDGFRVEDKHLHPRDGIITDLFQLPELVRTGTWKVVCSFGTSQQKNFTTEFEVKEYVLPSFEVQLNPENAFFYINDPGLSVDITAKYLYGKAVSGKAFVVFGVMDERGKKNSLPASLQRVDIISGKGKAKLTKEHIQRTFPNIAQLVKQSLYVSASVMTATGSEMVEAERRGIQIVTSPYTIHFQKTATYFKPGMPFDVVVYVTNPDDTPAKDIDVKVTPGTGRGKTQEDGTARLTVNTKDDGSDTLQITVKTEDSKLTPGQQAVAEMTALPYKTKGGSKNYLHISVQANELKIKGNLRISLNLVSPGSQNSIKHITYLILNKGKIVSAKRFEWEKGQSLVTLSLTVTKDMVPSFRIVAYYHVGTEVVSDSVWVDVKDTCLGKLEIKSEDPGNYQPAFPFSLTITGDPGAKVGLVAVDKGVYVLNSKNRLTQTKIWDVVEKQDVGCTAGSGANSMDVFYDAGLAFVFYHTGLEFESSPDATKPRSDPSCPNRPRRRGQRSLTLMDLKNSLASQAKYTDLERECCRDGMVDNLLGYTCKRRAQFINDGPECEKAFVYCCSEVARRIKDAKEGRTLELARESEDDIFESIFKDIVSRTQFPGSWLWETVTLPQCSAKDGECEFTSEKKKGYMRDSITTWEVTAISLSKTHGICVSEPFEMKVMKQFFVDLKLPYAAVRNEQVEIKAVLHNYLDTEIKVRVELTETEGVCSAASKKGKYRTTDIYMDALSSRAVPFVIIPMELNTHTIEVKAAAVQFDLRDGVKKDLRVVPEGIQTKLQTVSVVLDPSAYGGEQHERIDAAKLNYLVPGSTPQTFVSVTGELLSETIQAVISGKPLGSLIHQPGGCGEQNMIAMTGPVIATHYLDKTHQWASVGLDRRAEAIKFINNGYTQQLKYRKPDGSYSIFEKENTSTWLTAYVAKVFGMAYRLVPIEDEVLCSAIKWLVLNAQEPDGIFKEHGKVYQSEMMGGVPGKDVDVSLTAFILIAMQESRQCESKVRSLPGSIARAKEFLLKKIDSLKNPYAVALASYALANEGKHMVDLLNRFSSDKTHWRVPENHYSTLEATGYALLALVKAKEFDQAGRVVKWLTEQRFYGGGYGSTQATIIVFQAISEYMIELPKREDVDLKVTLNVTGRSALKKWTFTSDKTHLTRSDKYQFNKNLTVTATGAGRGTLSVVTVYNALPENRKEDCKNFELLVKLEKEPKVSYEGALETYKLTIEMLFLSTVRSATMSILDITMLTGFIADTNDLKKLTSGKDRYVQKIETDKQLSEKGSLILYLEQVSHEQSDRVVFRIHMMNRVGLLQPAAVTVYEYNSLENRCVKFYHPEKEGGALNRICHEDVCRCAEENCSYQKKRQDEDLDRFLAACGPNMDYVYKVKVVHANLSASIDHFTLEAEEIIKPGTDLIAKGAQRTFLAHPYCRAAMDLREGMSYLIMGMFEDVVFGKDRLLYMLGGGTWIEYWPTEVECQQPKFYDTCVSIRKDSDELVYYGCPN